MSETAPAYYYPQPTLCHGCEDFREPPFGSSRCANDTTPFGPGCPLEPVKPSAARTRQVGGDHYKGRAIQVWDIWEAFPELSKWEACAIKYILRHKPGQDRVQELKKAIHYLEYECERDHGQ